MSGSGPVVVPPDAFEAERHDRVDDAVRRKVEACATAAPARAERRAPPPGAARSARSRVESAGDDRPWRNDSANRRRTGNARRVRGAGAHSDRRAARATRARPAFAAESARSSARGLCNKCSDANWRRLLPKFRDAIRDDPEDGLRVVLHGVGMFDEQAGSLVAVLGHLASEFDGVAAGLVSAAEAFWDADPLSLPSRPDPKTDYAAFCDVGLERRRRVNLASAFLRLGVGPGAHRVALECLDRIEASVADAAACSDVAIRVAHSALGSRTSALDEPTFRASFANRLLEIVRSREGRVKDSRTRFDVEGLAAAAAAAAARPRRA